MENISSPELIKRLSEEDNDNFVPHNLTLVIVGHVCYNKGIDFAIEAVYILKKNEIDFLWLFVGAITESKWIEEVKRKGLQRYFKLVGVQSNPYSYIRQADIYVHPSRFEGKSIALDEAKILCKPIIVTNFSTVRDQFEDGVNATICAMDGKSLARAILNLYEDGLLRQKYIDYLKTHIHDNSGEVQKLYMFL